MWRRLDGLERVQPLPPGLGAGEERAADRADAAVGFEALFVGRAQLFFESVAEQRIELGAFDPVFDCFRHQITCL
jgi:hypothetical protein